MSEVPPGPEQPPELPDLAPPPAAPPAKSFEGYYARPGYGAPSQYYGTSEKLEALAAGYFGLNWVFLGGILVTVVCILIMVAVFGDDRNPLILPILYAVVVISIAMMSFPCNKKIGFGMGWSKAGPYLASVLLAIGSLFCAIISFVVLQQIAYGEIKRYGVRAGFLGIRKRDIAALVAEMKQHGR